MNVRHPQGVLHSYSIKNMFYDKIDLKAFLFSCDVLLTHLMSLVFFIRSESIKKLEAFICIQGVQKETGDMKWMKWIKKNEKLQIGKAISLRFCDFYFLFVTQILPDGCILIFYKHFVTATCIVSKSFETVVLLP